MGRILKTALILIPFSRRPRKAYRKGRRAPPNSSSSFTFSLPRPPFLFLICVHLRQAGKGIRARMQRQSYSQMRAMLEMRDRPNEISDSSLIPQTGEKLGRQIHRESHLDEASDYLVS